VEHLPDPISGEVIHTRIVIIVIGL